MMKLNNSQNLNEIIINEARKSWSPQFSKNGQEDVAEFIGFILDKANDQKNICEYHYFSFLDAYQYTIKTDYYCTKCKSSFSNYDNSFILSIPSDNYSFMKNFDKIFKGNLERDCENCGNDKFHFNKKIVKNPEYLIIQIMRFKYIKNTNSLKKDFKIIDIPEKITSTFLQNSYQIFGIIYHIGDSTQYGHYLSRKISQNGIDTYDDSRCYFTPNENKLNNKNAYILIYQKIQKQNNAQFSYEKLIELFIKFSDLCSLHVFDLIFSILIQEEFATVFKQICRDLVTYEMPWADRLCKFLKSLGKKNIIENPIYFIIRYMILAGQTADDHKCFDDYFILFLKKCIDNKSITIDEIVSLNLEISNKYGNRPFNDLINNLQNQI